MPSARAAERRVTGGEGAGANYGTIQDAINAAANGDEVVLSPGTYSGSGNRDLDFGGKAITVRSTDPNDAGVVAATIIDCGGAAEDRHRAFVFHTFEDANSVVAFTVAAFFCSTRDGNCYWLVGACQRRADTVGVVAGGAACTRANDCPIGVGPSRPIQFEMDDDHQ